MRIEIRSGIYTHTEVVNRKISLEAFFEICGNVAQRKVSKSGVYFKRYGEIANLTAVLANQTLEDILADRAEFEITDDFEEGTIAVNLSFDGKVKSLKATKETTVQEILDHSAEAFNINMRDYYLKGTGRDFDILDRKELLSTYYDDLSVGFEVKKNEKAIHEVQIIKISDDFDKTKKRESVFFKTEDIPSTDDVIAFIEKLFGKNETDLATYKLNAFEEPTKRVKLKGTPIKTFEVEDRIKIMVKDTAAMLNFELQTFAVFTSVKYPYDLEKCFEINIANEDTIADLKSKILTRLINGGVYTQNDTKDFYFQVLNTYNTAGKYLVVDSMPVKKMLFKTRKILVRPNIDRKEIHHQDICVFIRTRNPVKRSYENPVEVLIPDKFRNINEKNYQTFKNMVLSKTDQKDIGADMVDLVYLDYKAYKWVLVKNKPINIKDGDDLGIIVGYVPGEDDLQTDELLALKLSNPETTERKGYTEKAFKLNAME